MKKQDIQDYIQVIDASLSWASSHSVTMFPVEVFKDYRRRLLLSESEPDSQVDVEGKKGRSVQQKMSVADIVTCLLEAYYDVLNVDVRKKDAQLSSDFITLKVKEMMSVCVSKQTQTLITEDDIWTIGAVLHDSIGSQASLVYQSEFCSLVAPNISHIGREHWAELFSYLWNKNSVVTQLFKAMCKNLCSDENNNKPAVSSSGNDIQRIKQGVVTRLSAFHVVDDEEKRIESLKKTIGDIRAMLDMQIGQNQELFGQILDKMMISSDAVRKIVADVFVLDDVSEEQENVLQAIQMIRRQCSLDLKDSPEENLEKISMYYSKNREELDALFSEQGFSVEQVVAQQAPNVVSKAEELVEAVVSYWFQYVNNHVEELNTLLPHSAEVTCSLMKLFQAFHVSKQVSERVMDYLSKYGERESIHAVTDYITFELNTFVSTFGRSYMGFDEVKQIQEKASACDVKIADVSPLAMTAQKKRQDAKQALTVLEQSSQIEFSNMVTLLNLSFWDNFPKWENFVTMGLLYASDIPLCDDSGIKDLESIMKKVMK